MTKQKKFSSAQAIEIITDLAHDLSSAFVGGFTLSQDDAWQCAAALGQLLAEHSAAFLAQREVSVEDVAKIVEGAIADAMSGDWETARDDAATRILALFSPREASGEAAG